jgi:HD superfamily phosphohydrolase
MIRIRDPIHGCIKVTDAELAIIDNRVFQRLRGIKQLGFTDQAFPGATHTRYAHGLGAMYVASAMFDAVFPEGACPLQPSDRARLRQLVRLSLLLHDVGHPPASHASESAMPNRRALGLSCFTEAQQDTRASHEDYTVKLILDSELATLLRAQFSQLGVDPEDVAHLISGYFPERAAGFVIDGVNYAPLLGQMVSGEMDADRMDYLQRDSFFAGVSYGKFDQSWLLENLGFHVTGDAAYMALTNRAVFAFEDFLLSRYHMFVSVYYHYIPVGFDTMLGRYYAEAGDEFELPADVDGYIETDDIALWARLRKSSNRWAKLLASRQSYRRVLEIGSTEEVDLDEVGAQLDSQQIDHFISRDEGVVSKYYAGAAAAHPMYVFHKNLGDTRPISEYAKVFDRYAQPTRLMRIYVRPDQAAQAGKVVATLRN